MRTFELAVLCALCAAWGVVCSETVRYALAQLRFRVTRGRVTRRRDRRWYVKMTGNAWPDDWEDDDE
jgi:hypothetical protein